MGRLNLSLKWAFDGWIVLPPTTDEDQAEDLEVLSDTCEYVHISAAEVKYHHARLQDARLLPGGSLLARA